MVCAVLDTSRNSIGRVSRRGSERGLVLSADASSEVRWGARNTVTDLGTGAPNMRLLGGSVQKVCQSCALGSIFRVLRCSYHCKSCSRGRDRGELGSAFTSKGGAFGDLKMVSLCSRYFQEQYWSGVATEVQSRIGAGGGCK